jgi:hypothetical protein
LFASALSWRAAALSSSEAGKEGASARLKVSSSGDEGSVDTDGVGEPDVDDNVELIVCQKG